mmetsp:Transcript_11294/g.22792  ORF Transcript_11294/g.22792 Transcript_11294/m.22792 type:complete len:93 (-) Transcript_11294:65-343(-)
MIESRFEDAAFESAEVHSSPALGTKAGSSFVRECFISVLIPFLQLWLLARISEDLAAGSLNRQYGLRVNAIGDACLSMLANSDNGSSRLFGT